VELKVRVLSSELYGNSSISRTADSKPADAEADSASRAMDKQEAIDILRKLADGGWWCYQCSDFVNHQDVKCRGGECWHNDGEDLKAHDVWNEYLPEDLANKLGIIADEIEGLL
jgi:hypothetical protein